MMFELKKEAEIKHIFFFHGKSKDEKKDEMMDAEDYINKSLGLLRKNYIYVTKDKEVIIKNLGIRKKSNSKLSQKIFFDYLLPKIKEGEIKFSKAYLKNLIFELLEKNIELSAMRKDVDSYESYASKSSLQAQIAQKYGTGIHMIIPVSKNMGAGKDKHYITIEEFKQNNLKIEDIDLSNVWNELIYFIKPIVTKNIFQY